MPSHRWNAKQWYDERATTYAAVDRVGIKRYEYAMRLAPISAGIRVVDIGCKTGTLAQILRSRGLECTYHGFDISEVPFQGEYWPDNFAFTQCDVTKGLPVPDGWADRVYCLEVIEHVREPLAAIEEIARVLKDDGIGVLSVPNPYYWGNLLSNVLRIPDRQGHISAFTWIEMDALCRFGGLKVVRTAKVVDMIPYAWRGIRKGKYIIVKALFSWQSRCTQFLVHKGGEPEKMPRSNA